MAVDADSDGVGLLLSDGSKLSVFYNYSFTGFERAEDAIGLSLISVRQEEDQICIVMGESKQIAVSL